MSSSGSSQGSELARSADQSPLLPVLVLENEPAMNTIIPRPEYRQAFQARHALSNNDPAFPSPVILPNNTTADIKPKQNRALLPKASQRTPTSRLQSSSATVKTEILPQAPKRIEPKPHINTHVADSDVDSNRVSSLSRRTAKSKPGQRRESKDAFLVRSKLAGMSYKDIRREGGFTEAESTLRGRYRTLTKDKAERVRKPEWEDNDVSRLHRILVSARPS